MNKDTNSTAIPCLFLAAVFLFFSPLGLTASKPELDIAIVTDGPWARGEQFLRAIQNETRSLLSDEYNVKFYSGGKFAGRWSNESVAQAFARGMDARGIDVIITAGALASHQAILQSRRRGGLIRPVIAPVILDAKLQQVPRKGNQSGVRNLTYMDRITRLDRDLLLFREIVDFKHLVIIADRLIVQAMPGLTERVREAAKALEVEITVVQGDHRAAEIIQRLPAEADAALVVPLLRFSQREVEKLAQGFIERKLPSFSSLGPVDLEAGMFATASPANDLTRIARRVALQVQQIQLGRNPSQLDVSFPVRQDLVINMATARAINVWPRFSILSEATLMNEEPPPPERRLTIDQAMRGAIKANLELMVQDLAIARGAADVQRARARLLPQVDLSSQWRMIDSDRAQFARGQQPERTWDIGLTVQQLIFSTDAWAGLGIEQHLQQSREKERDRLRLDIAVAAARAYLNILRAEALEEIEENNLRLTQANRHRAEVRESIGISGLAEVYRWESNEASNRQAVLDAAATNRIARIELNRILNRPLDERFRVDDARLTDRSLLLSDPRIFDYVSDPWSFGIFRSFMAQRALRQAPELAVLNATVEAATTTLAAARRSRWAPTVAAQGEFRHELSRSGEGSNFPPPGGGLDDDNWQLGLSASLPVFTGGDRSASIRGAEAELSRLQTQRDDVQQRVEQRLRTALHRTAASYAGIDLSAQAAAAAEANLDIVTDGYGRGVLSVIDLLDAQNAALVASQAAANARYDFLLDLVDSQRAVGQFDYFMSDAERESYFAELEAWFARARNAPAQ